MNILLNIKKHKNLILLIVFAAVSLAGYIWLTHQPIFADVIIWAQQNFWLYFGVLVFTKIISIVWPPLPGGLLTLGSIPIIGWFGSFLAEVVGSTIGASVAYYLGRKYGYGFLKKIFDEGVLSRIQRIKVPKKRELETVFFLRLFTGVISEAISYGSGLIGIKFRNFFLATLLVEIMWLPIFYFLGDLLTSRNFALYIPAALILALIFWRMKGRYFE